MTISKGWLQDVLKIEFYRFTRVGHGILNLTKLSMPWVGYILLSTIIYCPVSILRFTVLAVTRTATLYEGNYTDDKGSKFHV